MGLIVGLTGGIGCGKSTVAKLLSQHGAQIIDTDLISHGLTGVGGAAITAINTHFG
ncbi:MAG: dephospho-CoA kinase, partial [Gallionella sp.]